MSLFTMEPDNSRDDGIASWGVGFEDFSGAFTAFENGSRWCSSPDFACDFEFSKGGAVTTSLATEAKF